MTMRGKAHKYGVNIDTDAIIPACYLNITDAEELAKYCMENLDPEFTKRVRPGDFIVARSNYGCGSSWEHAPLSIKANGISCVIADSFARIFFRNSINIALPLLECAESAMITETGDEIEVDLNTGIIVNHTKGQTFTVNRHPAVYDGHNQRRGLNCLHKKHYVRRANWSLILHCYQVTT